MRLEFLGTRANIPIRTPEHFFHSALLVECAGVRMLIDCGADWLGRIPPAIDAIVLTHAHPDHADGLRGGAPCPVYATAATWRSFHLRVTLDRRRLEPDAPLVLGGMRVHTVPVIHSLRAPANALVIASESGGRFAYAPDVLALPNAQGVLHGVDLYVGDGSALRRSIVRGRGEERVGHASIEEQLRWCADHRVPRATFTHCGRQVLRLNVQEADSLVGAMGTRAGVEASMARDGMELMLAGSGASKQATSRSPSRPLDRVDRWPGG
jgi:phosphoribosyl 1,2-cyclic phosphodiesterase